MYTYVSHSLLCLISRSQYILSNNPLLIYIKCPSIKIYRSLPFPTVIFILLALILDETNGSFPYTSFSYVFLQFYIQSFSEHSCVCGV